MSDSKIIALVVVLLGLTGLWLEYNNKLTPLIQAISQPIINDKRVNSNIAIFAIAFLVYLFVISFLEADEAGWLTALLVAGALVFNSQVTAHAGQDSLIDTITKIGRK